MTVIEAKEKLITETRNHHHFWIEDNILFESYMTLRGMRYRGLLQIEGFSDTDLCSDDVLLEIATKYKN